MIVGKLYCLLLQYCEFILALHLPSQLVSQQGSNTEETLTSAIPLWSSICKQSSREALRTCTVHAQNHLQSVSYKVSVTARVLHPTSREIRILMKTIAEDRCSDTTHVCISMDRNFLYKNLHFQAESTMKLKLLHFRKR